MAKEPFTGSDRKTQARRRNFIVRYALCDRCATSIPGIPVPAAASDTVTANRQAGKEIVARSDIAISESILISFPLAVSSVTLFLNHKLLNTESSLLFVHLKVL